MPYEIHLAYRNLVQHAWQTTAMVFGLTLAVVVMVYIPSTMASFYDDMIGRTIERNSPHVTVWPREKQAGWMAETLRGELGADPIVVLTDRTDPRKHNINGYHELTRRIAEAPGVVAAASFVSGDATVTHAGVDLGIIVEGIEPSQYGRVVTFAKHFADGHPPDLGPSDVAIGFRLAEKLRVHEGQQIRLATARTNRQVRVKAIFRSGYYNKDLHHAYVALPTAQRLFRTGREISGLAVRCVDLHDAVPVSQALRARISQKVRNWRDDSAAFLAEIAMVQRVTLFINVLGALTMAGSAWWSGRRAARLDPIEVIFGR